MDQLDCLIQSELKIVLGKPFPLARARVCSLQTLLWISAQGEEVDAFSALSVSALPDLTIGLKILVCSQMSENGQSQRCIYKHLLITSGSCCFQEIWLSSTPATSCYGYSLTSTVRRIESIDLVKKQPGFFA